MSRGTNPEIRSVIPIFLIVLRAMLRTTSEVRDFVTDVARSCESAVRLTKKLCLRVVARLAELPFALFAAEERLFMDRELVARDVVGLMRERMVESSLPRTQRLIRKSENEID